MLADSGRSRLGRHGEDVASAELRRRGYVILARRYRTRAGEIDIVARDGEAIVFVEVKTRASDRCGDPAEAVTPWKRRRLAWMAADYLARHGGGGDVPCRFDVVAIDVRGAEPTVTVYRDAFRVEPA
ncbi:MAG TPA: YraN family protein [Vicinamibacterales bacterium]|nr:YraN family protein [Vicinamibacterales bacterium]